MNTTRRLAWILAAACAAWLPGELSYASTGTGSGTHLATELFKSMIAHVPYQGSEVPSGGTAARFGKRTRNETERWIKVIERANIKPLPE